MRQVTAESRLVVGLTLNAEDGQSPSVWSSGAWQNIVFLYFLLTRSERIAEVVLVNHANTPATTLDLGDGLVLPLRPMDQTLESLDVLIVIGIQLGKEAIDKVRRQGGRAVFFCVGNNAIMAMENIVFDLKRSTGDFDGSEFDAIWTLPHHEATCKAFFEIIWRAPCAILPYLWNPFFVDQKVRRDGLAFGYRPQPERAGGKRIAVFEPNLNVVKTCLVPALICESAYRQAPELISAVHITNTGHVRQQAAFNQFAWSLEMTRKGVASYDDRFDTPSFLALYTDVVVSHQWENGLNNLFLDVLHGAYPLVHNSGFLRDVGYYYPEFDAVEGARALLTALREHDVHAAEYQVQCQRVLRRYATDNHDNLRAYEDGLFGLFDL